MTLSSPKVRLLLRNSKFRWLFLGVLGSRVGDTFSAVAFSWLALQSVGPAGVGIVLLASSLPLSIAGPIAGVMIERYGAVRCLVVENLIHGALILVLAGLVLTDSANFVVVIALVAAASMFSMATEVSQDVLMPAMVGNDELDDANSLLAVVWDTSALVGPAAAGFVVATGGVPAALVVDAVSFFLMAVAALGLSGVRAGDPDKAQPLSLASASSGFVILWRNRPAGILSLLSLLLLFTTGAMTAILPSYTEIELSGGAATFGVLMSIGGLLSLVGTLGGSNLGRRVATKPLLTSLAILRSVSLVPMVLFGTVPVAAASYGVFNLAEGPMFPLSRSAYQRAVPDEDRARAAGARSVLGVAGFPLGSAAGGAVVVVAGTTGSLVMVMACTLLIAFVLWPLPRDMRSHGESFSTTSDHEVSREQDGRTRG